VVGEKKELNAVEFFFLYKIADLLFAAMMSFLSYSLTKELRQDFSNSPNKTGISSGKTS